MHYSMMAEEDVENNLLPAAEKNYSSVNIEDPPHTEDPEDPEDPVVTPIPPLHRKGLPIWLFRFIRLMLCFCPFDAYVMFPLIFLIILAALGILSNVVQQDWNQLVVWLVIASIAVVGMIVWLRWAGRNPRAPQEKDVAHVKISDGVDHWPKAPLPPVRTELVAKGGSWFRDSDGRRLLLRGINFSAGTKLPASPPNQRETHLTEHGFTKICKDVSFVGRPFPLDELDLHLGRLRTMGLTFLRFLITWEAVEHAGPGIYDQDYLDYLQKVVRRCGQLGLSVFIDAHQDVWSRWTGGDGAPAWTLEKVGFCLERLDSSAAALTQQHWEHDYPKMVWNSNNSRLAAGTMWTLFFAGNDFAPRTFIDGEPVQEYLQRHFIAAMAKVAETLREEKNVVGFDILNEPSVGFVGVQDARDIGPNKYYVGHRVDAWSAIRLGAGETVSVDYFSSFMYIDGKRELNQEKVCAWETGPDSCVWHANGLWKMDPETEKPMLLKPHYFATNPRTGAPVDFLKDYGIPFYLAAAREIRAHIPDAIIFVEPILDMTDPSKKQEPELTANEVGAGFVWAPHYYDGITLMTKSFSRYFGMDSVHQKPSIGMNMIERSYGLGIAKLMHEAKDMGPGGCPVLIGECGIPFDIGREEKNKPLFFGRHIKARSAFHPKGDFHKCTHALDRTMRALEHAQVSYTVWCYQPENTNENGDGWNGEDLSLFSVDQVETGDEDNLFAGGRSLLAVIRPYPCRIAGDLVRFSFSLYSKDRLFDLVFKADQSLGTKETEIFIPRYQYPHGVEVHILAGGGSYEVDWDAQTLIYTHTEQSFVNHIVITKAMALYGSTE